MSNEEVVKIIKNTSASELIAVKERAILLDEKRLVQLIENHLLLK